MIQKLAATLVAFAVSFSALAAEIPMPAPRVVATPRGQEDSYPAQDVTFPNGVRGKPGLVYREAAGLSGAHAGPLFAAENGPAPGTGLSFGCFHSWRRLPGGRLTP